MPRLTPEQHAITKWQNQVRAIDARLELLKAERAQYVKLIAEMQQRSKEASGGQMPMDNRK